MVLLIGGHPRSGTTLLKNICNYHPDITVMSEIGIFQGLGDPYRTYKKHILKRILDKKRKDIFRKRLFDPSYFIKQRMSTLITFWNNPFVIHYLLKLYRYHNEPINVRTIETVLQSIFPQTRVVGDKYPDYVFWLDEFAKIDSLYRLIIYRDCRDVTSSTLNKAYTTWRNEPWIKHTNTAEKITKRWVRSIEMMERHKDNLHIIRYEDLVQEPKRELEALGRWLGVNPAGFPEKMVRNTSIGKYKSGLSDEELATVINIAGPTMGRLGYLF